MEGKRGRQRRCPRYGIPYDPEEAERAKKAPPRPTYLELLRDPFHKTGNQFILISVQFVVSSFGFVNCDSPNILTHARPIVLGHEFFNAMKICLNRMEYITSRCGGRTSRLKATKRREKPKPKFRYQTKPKCLINK